jgi:hypothetical protein
VHADNVNLRGVSAPVGSRHPADSRAGDGTSYAYGGVAGRFDGTTTARNRIKTST